MWEYVRTLQAQGVTVLLATNYLDEADRLCDRLTIIDHGKVVVTDTPAALKRWVRADVVQVVTERVEPLQAALAEQSWVQRIATYRAGDLPAWAR